MSYIIGIGGKKNSGKDIIAKILNYMFYRKGNAKFEDYALEQQKYDYLLTDRIFHFADPLKNNLSVLFDIDRQYFNIREFKDDKWYSFRHRTFIEDNKISSIFQKLYINDFKNLDDFRYLISENRNYPLVRLRTLMQIYGRVMRATFGDDIFVNSTIFHASQKTLVTEVAFIPDVRYANEAQSIKRLLSSTGVIIKTIRNIDDKSDNTESELCNFDYDYLIDNTGSLIKTYYQCQKIYKEIIKKK